MADIVTCCPECKVSFRATSAQLQAANGQVRCGACLTIFSAQDHEVVIAPIERDPASDPTDDLLIYDEMDADLAELDTVSPAEEDSPEQEQEQEQEQDNREAPVVSSLKPSSSEEEIIRVLGDEPFHEIPEFLLPPALPPRRKQWHWWMLSLLALAALGVQYAHFHADVLGHKPNFQSAIEELCDLTGCQIPTQIDLTKIQNSNLVIQSHPEYSNALLADAIIINRAKFEQPFPALLLLFTNLQGEAVAQRRFTPKEYLGGELTGATIMPINQPIKLSLAFIDPGETAINFSLFVAD